MLANDGVINLEVGLHEGQMQCCALVLDLDDVAVIVSIPSSE